LPHVVVTIHTDFNVTGNRPNVSYVTGFFSIRCSVSCMTFVSEILAQYTKVLL